MHDVSNKNDLKQINGRLFTGDYFFCCKCRHHHSYYSEIGKQHLDFKGSPYV